MLDERRVRRMAKLASYEAKEGKEDIDISAYYKKDYVSMNTWKSVLWVTTGYLFIVMLVMISSLEQLMESITITSLILIAVAVLVGYVLSLIIYLNVSKYFYRKQHDEARERVKEYCHGLLMLEKLYEKENVENE